MDTKKLTISLEDRRMSLKLDSGVADSLFSSLVSKCLNLNPSDKESHNVPAPKQETPKALTVSEPKEALVPDKTLPPEVPVKKKSSNNPVVGFLYIRCSSCGKERAFNSRVPISYHRCSCGESTSLDNLTRVYAECECGKSWSYLTNIKDESFDIPCVECGSPMPVFLNHKKGFYSS